MKRFSPIMALIVATFYFAITGFQCGSAEMTTAKLAMQQKDFEKAEQSLLKEVAKNDKNEEAWFLLGQVRLEGRKYVEMNEAYSKALSLSDAHKNEIQRNRMAIWSQLYNSGVNLYNKGVDNPENYDKAHENFSTAILLQPDSSSTYYVAALAQSARKDLDDAARLLSICTQKNPKNVVAARMLGRVHFNLAQAKKDANDEAGNKFHLDKATQAYETAYQADPADVENIVSLIEAYDKANNQEKALALTRDCVAKDPNNRICRYAYGVYLLKQDKFEESIAQFTRVTELEPGNKDDIYQDAVYNLGVANLNWGVLIRTDAEKKTTPGKEPKEDTAYKEKFRAALPYLKEAAETRQKDAFLWQQLGKVYGHLNMVKEMKTAFDTADKLLKEN